MDIVKLGIDVDSSSIAKAVRELDNLTGVSGKTEKSVTSLANSFNEMRDAAKTLAGLISEPIKLFTEFDKKIQNTANLTGASLEQIKSMAMDSGVAMGRFAGDAAEAFGVVGSKAPELLAMPSALKAVTDASFTLTDAAKATGDALSDVEAATATTAYLSQWSISAGNAASEAERFANVAAAGAQLGSASVSDMTAVMKNSGTVAASAGVSIEQFAAATQIMAARQLEGAEAGTALRNTISILMTKGAEFEKFGISAESINPKIVGLEQAFKNLAPIMEDDIALSKIFGQENLVAAKILGEGADKLGELTQQLTGTNTAYEQAEAGTKSISRQYEIFIANVKNLAVSIMDSNVGGMIASSLQIANSALGYLNENWIIVSGSVKAVVIDLTMTVAAKFNEIKGEIQSFVSDTLGLAGRMAGALGGIDKQIELTALSQEFAVAGHKSKQFADDLRIARDEIIDNELATNGQTLALKQVNTEITATGATLDTVTGKVKTHTAASKEASKAADDLAKKQKSLNDSLKEQIATFDMDAAQKRRWKAENEGLLNDEIDANLSKLEAMEEEREINKQVMDADRERSEEYIKNKEEETKWLEKQLELEQKRLKAASQGFGQSLSSGFESGGIGGALRSGVGFLGSEKGQDFSFGDFLGGNASFGGFDLGDLGLGDLGGQIDGVIGDLGGMANAASYATGALDLVGGVLGGDQVQGMKGIGTIAGTYFGGPMGAAIGGALGSFVGEMFSGETRTGGTYKLEGGAISKTEGPSGGDIARSAVDAAIMGTNAQINNILTALGSSQRVTSLAGSLESSGAGKGGVAFGGVLSGGGTFGELGTGGKRAEFEAKGNFTEEEAMQAFVLDLKQGTIQALQAADVPSWVHGLIDGLDAESLNMQEAVNVLNSIQLGQVFEKIGLGAGTVTPKLIEYSGGVEKLAAQTDAYYRMFFDHEEQAEKDWAELTNGVTESFASINQEVPRTKEEFRNIVEGLDTTTEEGAATYAMLMSLAPSLYAVQSAAASAQASLDSLANIAIKPDERTQKAWDDLNGSLTDMGFNTLPDTRAELDEYLNSFDTQDKANQDAISSLNKNSSLIDGYYTNLEKAEEKAAQDKIKEQERLQKEQEKSMAEQQRAYDSAARAQQSYVDSLMKGGESLNDWIMEQLLGEDSSATFGQQFQLAQAEFNRLAAMGTQVDPKELQKSAQALLELNKQGFGAGGAALESSVLQQVQGIAAGLTGQSNEAVVALLSQLVSATEQGNADTNRNLRRLGDNNRRS